MEEQEEEEEEEEEVMQHILLALVDSSRGYMRERQPFEMCAALCVLQARTRAP